jgi:hypothetical protein
MVRTPLLRIGAAAVAATLSLVALPQPSSGVPARASLKRAVAWQGRYFASAHGTATCEPLYCDTFSVRVRAERRGQRGRPAPVEFAIRWPSERDDFDLRVIRPDGSTVPGVPPGRVGSAEAVHDRRPMRGLYRVEVLAMRVTDSAYEGLVQVERIPRRVRGRPRPVLPNLQTLPPRDLRIAVADGYVGGDPIPSEDASCYPAETAETGATRCLRFDNVVANAGPGQLRMRFLLSGIGSDQRMQQVIDMTKGGPRYRDAGTYVWHTSHGHVHYEGFAGYRLSAVGEDGLVTVATGEQVKAGFCLQDTELWWWHRRGNAPTTFTYPGCLGAAEQDSAGSWGVMGISRGWADVYTWDLPDQYVPIDGLPDGMYVLETTADAGGRVKETSERDNAAWALLRISGDQVEVARTGTGPAPDPQ